MQTQIEELQQRNAELQQDVIRLQAERDSLDDIIEKVRQRIANMNY
jgi:FtsZ-binding cell division protein ZapB